MKIGIEDGKLRETLNTVCRMVRDAGGRALLVGGCVRDSLLGLAVKDLDIEVYGIEPEKLKDLLAGKFRIDCVGEAFAVIKIHGANCDIAIPRRESKTGLGHKGFEVMSDPSMTTEEAAARRECTINAMAFDPLTDELFDYFGGQKDLEARVLRHTTGSFVEDPLRVLRAMQFIARFELAVAPETLELCRTIEPEGLAPERIFEEWKKLILQGVRPSLGLEFLRDTGWLKYYPELEALCGCEQEPEWHPEGDAWEHTLICMDAFARDRIGDEYEDLVVGFAVLCHDLGKPATTKFERGRTRSIGHSKAGEEPTVVFMKRMTNQRSLIRDVVPLVIDHMRPNELYKDQVGDSAIRRLACRVGRIDRLVRVARADVMGSNPGEYDGFPAGKWLLDRARELEVQDSAPKPIVLGRHLMELGLEPGPGFKPILDACYEAQLNGEISDLDQGIALAKKIANAE